MGEGSSDASTSTLAIMIGLVGSTNPNSRRCAASNAARTASSSPGATGNAASASS
jgi:hypothetical protein